MGIGGQIFGVISKSTPCSLAMDIAELAITLNKCEEIKTMIRSN